MPEGNTAMDTLTEFRAKTHMRHKTAQRTRTIGIRDAHAIANQLDWSLMAELAQEAHTYLPAVLAEIDTLRQAHATNPERMKRRALMFGIATPNRDEVQSIAWAITVEEWCDTLAPMALANRHYRSLVTGKRARLGLQDALTTTIASVQRRKAWQDLSVEALDALPGVGPKVARMVHAVSNPDAQVFTVDLWHGRQLLHAAGMNYECKVAISPRAYTILENIWLEYVNRFFPSVPIFAVQWATWNVADGRHNPHHALWADLAA